MRRYLESSPQCDPGFRKEYHVWDAVDLPLGRVVRERIENQGGDRARFLHEPDHYFDYFSGLLAAPEARLTADITPAYAGLAVQRLAMICAGFQSRGVRPVAVYLMRDPVERVWSAVRMDVRRRGIDHQGAVENRLLRISDDDQYDRRTRYDGRHRPGRRGVRPGRCLLRLLRAAVRGGHAARPVRVPGHRLPRPGPRTAGECVAQGGRRPRRRGRVRALAQRFAPVYEAVGARFPDVDLPSLWPSMRFL